MSFKYSLSYRTQFSRDEKRKCVEFCLHSRVIFKISRFVILTNLARHIKEELDSLAGNNAPEDFAPNSITGPPPPGSDNNAIPDSVSQMIIFFVLLQFVQLKFIITFSRSTLSFTLTVMIIHTTDFDKNFYLLTFNFFKGKLND